MNREFETCLMSGYRTTDLIDEFVLLSSFLDVGLVKRETLQHHLHFFIQILLWHPGQELLSLVTNSKYPLLWPIEPLESVSEVS